MRRVPVRWNQLLAFAVLACSAGVASAHSDDATGGGFLSGYMHPLTGLDHLLAMVAVGIWGASLGRPLVWALPITFPLLMVVGGVLGISGVPVPHVELGIALSVIVLGLAILGAWRAAVPVAMAIIAAFGVLHGYAHGVELPSAATPAAYAAGFVVSTGLLHLAGIAIGMVHKVPQGPFILRGAGALIALTGVWIVLGMPGMA